MRNILIVSLRKIQTFREEVKALFKFTDIETARKAKNTIEVPIANNQNTIKPVKN